MSSPSQCRRPLGSEHAAGGAPASLVVWAAERIPTAMPMQVARVTIDLMRPVPVAPLTLETEVLREGRKIQLCAVRLRRTACSQSVRRC